MSQAVDYAAMWSTVAQSHMRKEPVMRTLRYVGLDVHAASIAIAVAEADRGEVRSVGTIPNTPDALRAAVRKVGPAATLQICYEAGPTGYTTYWQLASWGYPCVVAAPSLVPVRAGDRVKTDRRDALKLARALRAGEVTPVWVPSAAQEALRELVRAREAAVGDQTRARQRVRHLLLRHGVPRPAGVRAWSTRYLAWLRGRQFADAATTAVFVDHLQEVEHAAARVAQLEQALETAIAAAPPALQTMIAALQALRGVARVAAATIVAEVGSLTRFARARQLMGYAGCGVCETSSGARIRRHGLTKTGNAHLRRIIMEAAHAARFRPAVGLTLKRRQAGLSPAVIAIAWQAQQRLAHRHRALLARGKPHGQVIAAVGRELLGFVWAIGQQVAAETAA